MTPRDPVHFMQQLRPVLPRSLVPLTRKDAITQVLVRQSRTMGEADARITAEVICEQAKEAGYDPLLVLAVIQVESYYDHLAVSVVGAEGLMQLMPTTAAWVADIYDLSWSEGHSFDPELNVRLGVRYLAQLHKQFKRLDLALTAYNRGPGATRHIVNRYGDLPEEIYDFYAGPVLRNFRRLRRVYGDLPLS